MTMTIEVRPATWGTGQRACLLGRSIAGVILLGIGAALTGCAAQDHPHEDHSQAAGDDGWSVTAWGESYEIFPEVDSLRVGEEAEAHTHVTRLDGFKPMVAGTVEIVLADAAGERVFTATEPERPGIFNVRIEPQRRGEFDLTFRIREGSDLEEIRGGRVRVGGAEEHGALLVAPAPKGTEAGEPVDFLKEEQWRSDFATGWVRSGHLASSGTGLARIRPPAGGEAEITAPVDGVIHALAEWPFPGRRVERGAALFRLVPSIAAERSLATLEADLASLDGELTTARARLERLQELFALDATSRRELEEADNRVATLEARRKAAERDLSAARSTRQGGSGSGLILRAPLAGEIAAVAASPGATVAAGQVLARLVRTDRRWIEVALSPTDARQVQQQGASGLVLTDGESPPLRLEAGLRLISVAPEFSSRTGTVAVLFEAPADAGLTLGTTMEGQVLFSESVEGIVIPSSAVIDDGGVSVVYLQLSGESFVRQEVTVLERQGDRLMVDGLTPGQRLVESGGAAIRRASLLASGDSHGHVH